MKLTESSEMYLKAILYLSQQRPIRLVDVAEYKHYSKASVSRALGLLRDRGMITLDLDGFIWFTELGRKTAEHVVEKQTLLFDLLRRIGVSEETAAEESCCIEHIISDETFEALKLCLH